MEERELPNRAQAEGGDVVESTAPPATSHLQRLRDATGEGRRTVSWIWYGTNTSDPDAQGTELYEGIRVEWCKAFARLRRWQEQIPLLREEMRRTLVSLKHRAKLWEARMKADVREGAVGEGARAYAARQARVYTQLGEHFQTMWRAAPANAQINLDEALQLEIELADDDDAPAANDDDNESDSDDED
ncbi:hypothetical protein BD626DRAFT_574870 [Schizophyllum amplum]|uniref:Uncharacterized protein n=1 Tax=Schizophyllum amplum TaxID=97359 RepID=A0A550BX02_9AGAR|nr:hypothetical protein BD626DRAFT_574870 [Auriculariopsis ampla]